MNPLKTMKMKRLQLKFSRYILLAATLSVVAPGVGAQTYTDRQKIVRSFPANAETRLDLTNKYGTVHVVPWKKDSVHIEIDLFVKSSSTSKLEKLKRSVDFEFTDTKYYIIARTDFGGRGGSFFSDLKEIIPSKNQVKIDYTVHVPPSMNITISNKYGDIYIDDMKGSVSVNLSNGDIKANSLKGESNISLNFGNGIITELNNAKLNIAYADLEIQQVKQLNIESKSSKIRIHEAGIVKTASRRDKFTVSSVDNLSGESWFSDIWLYKLNEEINYYPKYGALKVDSIANGFSFINVNTENADLRMVFSRQASYQLEVLKHDDVILQLPEEYGELEVIDQEVEATHLKGKVGPYPGATSQVKIKAPKKCIINIQTR
jgi:hypothetical protein